MIVHTVAVATATVLLAATVDVLVAGTAVFVAVAGTVVFVGAAVLVEVAGIVVFVGSAVLVLVLVDVAVDHVPVGVAVTGTPGQFTTYM